jgi:nucleoside-diphosphate-sugar epimerase
MQSRLRDRSILLTGGLGFLGLNLVPALLAAGARVSILNRSLDPLALAWLDRVAAGQSVAVHRGDIADAEKIHGWLAESELVVNLAGESGAVKSLSDAQADMQVNIAGHLNLLDAVRRQERPPRVVFVSSRLVYGVTGPAPVSESRPPLPTSLYGLHKLTVEHYHRLYWQHFGVPFTILRLTNPYGPYQLPQRRDYGVVNRFVMAAIRGETIRLYGGAPQLRDYIYVGDVVDAVLRVLADERAAGETLNVGAGVPVGLGAMARAIVDAAGSGRIEDVPWPALDEKVETGDFVCDTSRIGELLGWRAGIGLAAGLRQTVDCYRALLP